MRKATNCIVVLLGLLTVSHTGSAALLAAKADSVTSLVLHQDRPIDVYLPEESSKDPSQRFETLYVLDGDWNTKIVTDVVNFMRQLGMMPPVIVVGIPNVSDANGRNTRDHDLSPTVVPSKPGSGGAADFLQFLRTELLPYVDQHYPTNGVHLIHGHSLGGLFLMYMLANNPQPFDGYLALDPAMWWDNHSVNAVLGDRLGDVPAPGKAIYIAGRSGAGVKEMALDGLESAFRDHASAALHWKLTSYDDETHDSLKLKGTYDGLKYLYGGYSQDPIKISPSEGTVIEGHPIRLVVSGSRIHIHYTTDGSEPTDTSPTDSDGAIPVDKPEKTRLKLLSNRGVFDRTIPIHLKTGVPIAPSAHGKHATVDTEWHYSVYSASAWPRIGAARPSRRGTAKDTLSFEDFGQPRFAARVRRSVRIPEDGYYVFAVVAGQARLRLDDTVLTADDGETGQSTHTYLAPLRRGVYSMSVDFLRADDNSELHVVVIQCNENEPLWWHQKPWLELHGK